jgi:hypothetical protein
MVTNTLTKNKMKPMMPRADSHTSVCSDPALEKKISFRRAMSRKSPGGSKRTHKTDSSPRVEQQRHQHQQQDEQQAAGQSQQCCRRVHFPSTVAQVVGYVPSVEEMTADERLAAFMNSHDLQRTRLDAKHVTRHYRSKDTQVIQQIDEAYAKAVGISCSFLANKTSKGIDDDCSTSQDSTTEADSYERFMREGVKQIAEEFLTQWACKKVSGRGLERYTSAKHRAERAEFAIQSRRAVLRLTTSPDITTDQIAGFYEEYARSATVYARMTGEADANAAIHAVQAMNHAAAKKVPAAAATTRGKVGIEEEGGGHAATQKRSTCESEITPQAAKKASFDRKELLLQAKQQSSSARLLVHQLGKATKRLDSFVSI